VKLLRHLLRVPVTLRSRAAGSAGLRVVVAHHVTRIDHVLRVPHGACPVSRNPIGGTLTLGYVPAGSALEVVSLHAALAWACSGQPGAPRSAEELAAWAARESAKALGVPVVATLDLTLRPGRQRLCVQASAC
jgi:hypothetical protein